MIMQKIRRFYWRNKRFRFAMFSYDPNTHKISETLLNTKIDSKYVPIMLSMFKDKGYTKIPAEATFEVLVQGRVVPPGRMNIGEILYACGLKEYDEIDLLLANNGRSTHDDMYLEEIFDDGPIKF